MHFGTFVSIGSILSALVPHEDDNVLIHRLKLSKRYADGSQSKIVSWDRIEIVVEPSVQQVLLRNEYL